MTSPSPKSSGEPESYDPVFRHAWRELIVIMVLFASFCGWSLAVCYAMGYLPAGAERPDIDLVLGMPGWAFWGILIPWVVVDVVAVWFCFFYMVDDDLGEAHEGEDLAEQVEHLHETHRHEPDLHDDPEKSPGETR